MSNKPLIKFTIYFIIGILISTFANPDLLSLSALLILILLISSFLLYSRVNLLITNNRIVWSSVISILLIIISGMLYRALLYDAPAQFPYAAARINNMQISGIIVKKELPRVNYNDFYIKTIWLVKDKDTLSSEIKLLCKLKSIKNEPASFFKIGDTLHISGTIQKGRERRNPFEYDYNEYLNSRGIAGLFYIKSANDISIKSYDKINIQNFIYELRLAIAKKIDELYVGETSALIKGLLLADRSGIDYDTKEAFVNSGVIHVLAVSGLHVGYIVLIFLFLFSRLNIYARNLLAIAGLFFFVIITGAPPSVLRASIMATILILSNLSLRKYDKFNAIALAALVILVFNPDEIFNAGFLLSFSAVLSIFIFYPIISKKINSIGINSRVLKSVLLFIGVSLSAQLGTLPFTLYYFNKLSIISLAANLIVIPLIGIIVLLGITSLLSGILLNIIATYYAFTNEVFSSLLFTVVKTIGKWNYSYLFVPQFSYSDALVYYTAMSMCFIFWRYLGTVCSKIIFVLLLCFNLIVYLTIDNNELLPDSLLSVVMIDIGQGDSFLIKFPNGKTALIDAGNAMPTFDSGSRIIYPLLQNLGISRINYAFVTHLDADHYKGYESLIRSDIIDTVFKPTIDLNLSHDVEFENLITSCNLPIYYYDRQNLKIGNVKLYILNEKDYESEMHYSTNDKSGIIKLVYGNRSILFTGDAGVKVERNLIDKFGSFLNSDILKLGHHGSKTSTSRNFLNTVSPDIALISAGQFNRFNHPAEEIVERLLVAGTQIFRTDIDKAIVLNCDGNNFRVKGWK